MFTSIKESVLKRLPVNLLKNMRLKKKGMDRNYTKTVFNVITLVLIDVRRKQSRNMSVSLCLFEVLNKCSVAASEQENVINNFQNVFCEISIGITVCVLVRWRELLLLEHHVESQISSCYLWMWTQAFLSFKPGSNEIWLKCLYFKN